MDIRVQDSFVLHNETVHTVVLNCLMRCNVLLTVILNVRMNTFMMLLESAWNVGLLVLKALTKVYCVQLVSL